MATRVAGLRLSCVDRWAAGLCWIAGAGAGAPAGDASGHVIGRVIGDPVGVVTVAITLLVLRDPCPGPVRVVDRLGAARSGDEVDLG